MVDRLGLQATINKLRGETKPPPIKRDDRVRNAFTRAFNEYYSDVISDSSSGDAHAANVLKNMYVVYGGGPMAGRFQSKIEYMRGLGHRLPYPRISAKPDDVATYNSYVAKHWFSYPNRTVEALSDDLSIESDTSFLLVGRFGDLTPDDVARLGGYTVTSIDVRFIREENFGWKRHGRGGFIFQDKTYPSVDWMTAGHIHGTKLSIEILESFDIPGMQVVTTSVHIGSAFAAASRFEDVVFEGDMEPSLQLVTSPHFEDVISESDQDAPPPSTTKSITTCTQVASTRSYRISDVASVIKRAFFRPRVITTREWDEAIAEGASMTWDVNVPYLHEGGALLDERDERGQQYPAAPSDLIRARFTLALGRGSSAQDIEDAIRSVMRAMPIPRSVLVAYVPDMVKRILDERIAIARDAQQKKDVSAYCTYLSDFEADYSAFGKAQPLEFGEWTRSLLPWWRRMGWSRGVT
jgi:hypothetical protein